MSTDPNTIAMIPRDQGRNVCEVIAVKLNYEAHCLKVYADNYQLPSHKQGKYRHPVNSLIIQYHTIGEVFFCLIAMASVSIEILVCA